MLTNRKKMCYHTPVNVTNHPSERIDIMNGKIPKPPYFSGLGREEKISAWKAEHLPAGFDEAYPYAEEAGIAWNLQGGRPSGHYHRELSRAVECHNSGEPYTTPNADFNRADIARRQAELHAGVDTLTPALQALGI